MAQDTLDEFKAYRERMNTIILDKGTQNTKRFFAIDSRVYEEGALPTRTKEMMGLVASLVLRCNDCITYHVIQCVKAGVSDDEFFELFDVGLVVGGSITIPHIRKAVEMLELCRTKEQVQ